ncbi:(2Fe-2S) ferredoxin domain-containing protein [Spirochaetes bacterium]|uniref:(2Fe-2S) ferredoxin domain-containing protein n=1 Tax=Candidatus Scatousia excrementipullorum TaxID=2840936 RepID=A0A9D9H1F1_9BACT|nr:(2Fe-2S) ferredoxin domain-containing protein [Candidatus Scatousia excrementipullorum]
MTMKITVCMGSSCFARGNDRNLEFIENYIKDNGLEAEIELSGARCEGKCATGPNIYINGVEYNEVDEDKIREILSAVKK